MSLLLSGSQLVPAKLPELPIENNLRTIILSDTAVEDIGALRRARYLDRLLLCNTLVEDLRPLAALDRLENLQLDGCTRLRDLGPLRSLKNLQSLTFERTAVTDASIVDELPYLRWVRFAVPPPGPFGWVRGLEHLNIAGKSISDLSPLAGARRLETLRAAHSGVVDLSPLRELEQLVELDVSHTRVATLDPLVDVWNLRGLFVAGTAITTLGVARDMWLQRLDASYTRVDDLGTPQASLRVLRISGTRIGPVPDLRALQRLRRLDIAHLDQGELDIIAGLQLRALVIAHTGIRDLAPVRHELLEWLDLRWSQVRALAQLQRFARTLKHLAVDVDQAPELAALAAMQLTHLTIEGRGTSIVEASWLTKFRHLEELELIDCVLDNAWPLNRLRNLKRLIVPATLTADSLVALQALRPTLRIN
ncbi:MAG: hypothetical protein ABI867_00565 [Kofleriaceae bacterium]